MNRIFHAARWNALPFVIMGLLGGALIASAACVPLGGWLYDDPTFVFSELTLRGRGTPDDTLEMVLTACNRNDYPVEARAIEVSLNFAGASLGPAEFSQPFTLLTRDSTKLTVPFPMPRAAEGTHGNLSYIMTGYTTLVTPIGERRVELFQRGNVQLKPRDEAAHVRAVTRPCRPGRSTLPSYMPTPIMLGPPQPPPPPPPVQSQ